MVLKKETITNLRGSMNSIKGGLITGGGGTCLPLQCPSEQTFCCPVETHFCVPTLNSLIEQCSLALCTIYC